MYYYLFLITINYNIILSLLIIQSDKLYNKSDRKYMIQPLLTYVHKCRLFMILRYTINYSWKGKLNGFFLIVLITKLFRILKKNQSSNK